MIKSITSLRPVAAAAMAVAVLAAPVSATSAMAAGEGAHIERQKWSFAGFRGHFDQNQLQRGFQIYREVCSTCHGISRISFRNLSQPGGPGFPEDRVTALAASYKVQDSSPGDDGKPVIRPGRLSDTIPGPYKNEQEARSIHNGALPPDLSLMAKARNVDYHGSIWAHPFAMLKDVALGYQEGGADYIYALLTGYSDKAPAYRKEGTRLVAVADKDVRDEKAVVRCATVEAGEAGKPDVCTPVADGMHYNAAFPGHQIAMAQPIRDGQVKYGDGSPTTVAQYASDLGAFLSWTADPSLDARKSMGWQVMLYLLVTAVLLFVAKKRIWSDVH